MPSRIFAALIATVALLAGTGDVAAQRLQTVYDTPDAAMQDFGDAAKAKNLDAFRLILGDDYSDVIPPVSNEDYDRFIQAWNAEHGIIYDDPETAHIAVGKKGWTLPIPLSKIRTGWIFDMDDARDEIRVRTIGANELATIKVMLAYTDAQQEYAQQDRTGDGVPKYAMKFESSPGTKDGLYWPTAAGEPASPIGPLFVEAAANKARGNEGFHGYHFRILTSQGKDAPGGAMSYVVNGKMVRGYGLLAWPVQYDETGVMTFMVNQLGQVFEKNLGPNTASLAAQIGSFNPDSSWTRVKDDETK